MPKQGRRDADDAARPSRLVGPSNTPMMDPDLVQAVFGDMMPGSIDIEESKLWNRMWEGRAKRRSAAERVWKEKLTQVCKKVMAHAHQRVTVICAAGGDERDAAQAQAREDIRRSEDELRDKINSDLVTLQLRDKIKKDCAVAVKAVRRRVVIIAARELVERRHPEFLCPIGRDLMTDPVVAADGFTCVSVVRSCLYARVRVRVPLSYITDQSHLPT